MVDEVIVDVLELIGGDLIVVKFILDSHSWGIPHCLSVRKVVCLE